ncbi:hypothetical protein PHSY_000327 [Pseudozyma hubeiensis SY62]|uniref:ATP synthase subunit d, mitochondrial n=1 Tax=Pseudozyma hubeiensis (strain SY62) TaxID=1305764 RepID=R9NWB0_PSEHS|nr:hypothetical protein PHSY_000327 [Pseudozyma hubeiensis SY62]GAC92771.1 hypothetical protein PHSY_000327 [Pseudozyma hubeiensis SY62]
MRCGPTLQCTRLTAANSSARCIGTMHSCSCFQNTDIPSLASFAPIAHAQVEQAQATSSKIEAELKDLKATLKNIEDARPFDQLTVDDVVAARPEIGRTVDEMVKKGKWTTPGYDEKFGKICVRGSRCSDRTLAETSVSSNAVQQIESRTSGAQSVVRQTEALLTELVSKICIGPTCIDLTSAVVLLESRANSNTGPEPNVVFPLDSVLSLISISQKWGALKTDLKDEAGLLTGQQMRGCNTAVQRLARRLDRLCVREKNRQHIAFSRPAFDQV